MRKQFDLSNYLPQHLSVLLVAASVLVAGREGGTGTDRALTCRVPHISAEKYCHQMSISLKCRLVSNAKMIHFIFSFSLVFSSGNGNNSQLNGTKILKFSGCILPLARANRPVAERAGPPGELSVAPAVSPEQLVFLAAALDRVLAWGADRGHALSVLPGLPRHRPSSRPAHYRGRHQQQHHASTSRRRTAQE